MENILTVYMSKRQSELTKPVKYLLLGKLLASLGIFYFLLQITILSIFRDDAQMLFVDKWLMVLDDVGVI